MVNTPRGPRFFVFTSAPETQSMLITQAKAELASGKSNSVTGNYACRVGLVQTQLRCKTRGEGCECKSTGFRSVFTPLIHSCWAMQQHPPITLLRLSLTILFPLSFFLQTRLQQPPSVWEDKKSPFKRDTSFNTAPCCLETGRTAPERAAEIAAPHLTRCIRTANSSPIRSILLFHILKNVQSNKACCKLSTC